MKIFLIDEALLSIQGALLDAVTPELRAVIINTSEDRSLLYIRLYYDGEVSEETIELWNCACTETTAALRGNFFPDESIERLDYPAAITFPGRYAYLRKEGETKDIIDGFVSRKFMDSNNIIGNFIHPVTEESVPTTVSILHETENGKITIPAKPAAISFETEPIIAYGLIAVQRALLGVVTPELRFVIVDATKQDHSFYVAMYYDKEVTKDTLALWELAISKASADLGPQYALHAIIARLDCPQKPPFRGSYAYIRKESD